MAMQFTSVRERIFIALDVASADAARRLIDTLGDDGQSYKIGLELFTAAGPGLVRELADAGKTIFLDLKFHDIPNTVAGAVRSVAGLGAKVINLHASGGAEMMRAARSAVGEGGPAIIGVTVLTSLDDQNLKDLGFAHTAEGQVLLFARAAHEAGLQGVVCSPREIELLRGEFGPEFLLITPGIRPEWAAAGDQKRIMTPREAFKAGASALVIGRPVTGAPEPAAALRRIFGECVE
jgi:orotidine-5'-phosphate decarboxylase